MMHNMTRPEGLSDTITISLRASMQVVLKLMSLFGNKKMQIVKWPKR